MALSRERIRHMHARYSADPVYQQILSIAQEVMPDSFAGIFYQPTDQQLEIAVKMFSILDNSLAWGTSCLNCSRLLDASITEYNRAEELAERLRRINAISAEESARK